MHPLTIQDRAVQMFRNGVSFSDISKRTGTRKSVVRKLVSPVFPNACKPSIRLTTKEIATMERMRFRGYTLQEIANMMDRSIMTVYKYTQHIRNARRLNRMASMNTRHGYVDGYTRA